MAYRQPQQPPHAHASVMDEEDGNMHCLGTRCFQVPHEQYVAPQFYDIPLLRGEKVPGRDYRWMAELRVKRKVVYTAPTSLTGATLSSAALGCKGSEEDDMNELPLSPSFVHMPASTIGIKQGEEDDSQELPMSPSLTTTPATPVAESVEATSRRVLPSFSCSEAVLAPASSGGAAAAAAAADTSSATVGTPLDKTRAPAATAAAAPQVVKRQQMQVRHGIRTRLTFQRGIALPQCMGLGDDGRWRWQGLPLSFLVGLKLDHFYWLNGVGSKPRKQTMAGGGGAAALQLDSAAAVADRELAEGVEGGLSMSANRSGVCVGGGRHSFRAVPSARLLVMTPLFGKLAVKVSVDVLPRPALNVRRVISLGTAKLSLLASMQADPDGKGLLGQPRWTLRVDWRPADSMRVRRLEGPGGEESDTLQLKYTRGIRFSRDCRAEVAGHMEVPASVSSSQAGGMWAAICPKKLALDSFRLTQYMNTRGKRDPPKSVRRYLRASTNFGNSDVISVVPGHWIDPGFEPGAAGEREFNLEVADVLERKLRGQGWEVLRPDRDAPNLQWEEYLNWVSRQTLKGVPVIEIHGQGSNADYRGLVLGVIGDKDAPLNKELASKFGLFAMDWRELAVPRRGGVIVESFNSDEVMQMAPWHRTWAVNRLATRMAECVDRASAPNRLRRQQEQQQQQQQQAEQQQRAPDSPRRADVQTGSMQPAGQRWEGLPAWLGGRGQKRPQQGNAVEEGVSSWDDSARTEQQQTAKKQFQQDTQQQIVQAEKQQQQQQQQQAPPQQEQQMQWQRLRIRQQHRQQAQWNKRREERLARQQMQAESSGALSPRPPGGSPRRPRSPQHRVAVGSPTAQGRRASFMTEPNSPRGRRGSTNSGIGGGGGFALPVLRWPGFGLRGGREDEGMGGGNAVSRPGHQEAGWQAGGSGQGGWKWPWEK